MVITKKQIITALETEPLKAGSWINSDNYSNLQTCPVCAVGAVMRSVLDTPIKGEADFSTLCNKVTFNGINSVVGSPGTYKVEALEDVKNGNYLTALSVYFEGMVGSRLDDNEDDTQRYEDYIPTLEDRKELINFVVEYFPEDITVSV